MFGLHEPDAVVTASFLTLLGVCFTTVYSARAKTWAQSAHAEAVAAKEQAAEANDAVNHRHPDSPRLFDLVVDTRAQMNELIEWRHHWDTLPADLDSGADLVRRFDAIDVRMDELRREHAEQLAALARLQAD